MPVTGDIHNNNNNNNKMIMIMIIIIIYADFTLIKLPEDEDMK